MEKDTPEKEAKTHKESFLKLSLASKITLGRVLFIPLFLAALLSDWPLLFANSDLAYSLRPWLAAAVFALIAATDAVDGYIARRRNEVTTFGKFIDPLADKLLVTAALLALVQINVLLAWIAFVIIAREFIVSGLRMVALANGIEVEVSNLGKFKTWLQSVAIVMFIVKDNLSILGILDASPTEQVLILAAWAVMLAAIGVTVVSLLSYWRSVSERLNQLDEV
ncbi:MAG: CDP-diacylglycerol--glycerol-3-phosphate 3-phosphatidyltransferase [Coriobacteriia bacterium]|nr:CDP-diacylglycerol--glycerol-3-phosphate 3-phosphatidyltransferase [Coriobacteriia bacterium]